MENIDDLKLLMPMVTSIYGQEGTYQVFKQMESYFQDNGAQLDPEMFKKKLNKWFFTRKGYALRNSSFDKKTFQKMDEEYGADSAMNTLVTDLLESTANAIAVYQNIYLPNVVFEKLLKVPTGGVDFYEEFGFARNTTVEKTAIKKYKSGASAGEKGSLIRNHYRAIADGAGLTLDDMTFYKSYLGEYGSVNKNGLIIMGDDTALGDIKALYSQYDPVSWEIVRNGIPTGVQGEKINGMVLINVDWTPENKAFIFNGDADTLITKLESKNPAYRGLAIETDDVQDRFEDVELLKGAKIVIQEEGYEVTGRLQGLWVDLDADNFAADRIMKTAGIVELNEGSDDARAKWYKGVADAK